MAQGYKDFTAGAVLTAADLEDYNQNQSTMRFASAAARDAALTTVKTEGMRAYLIDLNVETVYSGAAWSSIGPVHGALTAVVPTLTQSGTVTKTVTNCTYTRIGRWIQGSCLLAITGAGTASNAIQITGLPTSSAGTDVVGQGYFSDASTTTVISIRAYALTSTAIQFHEIKASTAGLAAVIVGSGAQTTTVALASGDSISFTFAYEAGADA